MEEGCGCIVILLGVAAAIALMATVTFFGIIIGCGWGLLYGIGNVALFYFKTFRERSEQSTITP